MEEFPAEKIPQPDHSLVVVNVYFLTHQLGIIIWKKVAEVYPVGQVVHVVACADKKKGSLDKRLRGSPIGSLAVGLRPKNKVLNNYKGYQDCFKKNKIND